MTNREIASLIVGGHNVEFAERCIIELTEALNEAEKRSFDRFYADPNYACQLVKEAAFERGALQMRERAAAETKINLFVGCPEKRLYQDYVYEAIRALPLIEGESK